MDYKKLVNHSVDKDAIYIANCMDCSMQQETSESTFNLLCEFADKIVADLNNQCFNCAIDIQIVTDIIADLYFDYGWGYRDEESSVLVLNEETEEIETPKTLNEKDLEERNVSKRDMVVSVYLNRINDLF